jgi:hypothetical protein
MTGLFAAADSADEGVSGFLSNPYPLQGKARQGKADLT